MSVFIQSEAPFFVSLLQMPRGHSPYDEELTYGSLGQPGEHTFRTHHIYMPTVCLAKNKERFRYQFHEGMEIIYITKGCGTLYLSDQELVLNSGDIAFIHSNELHNFQFDMGQCERLCVGFFPKKLFSNLQTLPAAAKAFADNQCHIRRLILSDDPMQPIISAYLQDIIESCRKNSDFLSIELQSILLRLISRLLEARYTTYSHSVDAIPKIIKDTINYIGSHTYAELSTAQISGHLGYTSAYFCREFKKYFGITFTEYSQILKIEASKEILLKEPDFSLPKLAATMGYETTTYFATMFKKHTGISPLKFIEENKKH